MRVGTQIDEPLRRFDLVLKDALPRALDGLGQVVYDVDVGQVRDEFVGPLEVALHHVDTRKVGEPGARRLRTPGDDAGVHPWVARRRTNAVPMNPVPPRTNARGRVGSGAGPVAAPGRRGRVGRSRGGGRPPRRPRPIRRRAKPDRDPVAGPAPVAAGRRRTGPPSGRCSAHRGAGLLRTDLPAMVSSSVPTAPRA